MSADTWGNDIVSLAWLRLDYMSFYSIDGAEEIISTYTWEDYVQLSLPSNVLPLTVNMCVHVLEMALHK